MKESRKGTLDEIQYEPKAEKYPQNLRTLYPFHILAKVTKLSPSCMISIAMLFSHVMIEFDKFVLENGLRVLHHYDPLTPMVATNLLYCVGSADESPEQTGMAHLFEHLMFSGSKNAPNYDELVQNAGGENNAYTNSDMTNFYQILPAQNIELGLFLEADRMENLLLNEQSLKTQKKVVIEEFLETCTNQPYGMAWHHLLDMSYDNHPYKWPTIGIDVKHIEEVKIDAALSFYKRFYSPENAILAISGNIDRSRAQNLCEKYFSGIKPHKIDKIEYSLNFIPCKDKRRELIEDVSNDALYMAFKMSDRLSDSYYYCDLLTDVLAGGKSSRLYRRLIKNDPILVNVDAYISGNNQPGLLIIEAQPADGYSLDLIEERIWEELNVLCKTEINEVELKKQKNKVKTNLTLSEVSILNKAMSLSYYESLGSVDLMNNELSIYDKITSEGLLKEAQKTFTLENISVLRYFSGQT